MTFKEFLEFISQDSGHFIGFLIVLGILTKFIIRIFHCNKKNEEE